MTRVKSIDCDATYLTAAELYRVAAKLHGSAKITQHERDSIVDVLRRVAEAQQKWDMIHLAPSRDRNTRPMALVGVLGHLLGRWSR